MNRLKIAVDCDDVLVPTAEQIVAAYNRDFGTQVSLEHFYSPATLDTWGTDDEQEAIARVGMFLRTEEHAQIEPHPEAVEAVGRLALIHELHLVTGRSDYLEPVTEATLARYFPGCFKTIEHTNYYEGVKKRSKGEVCKDLGADLLIDDHIVHGESVLQNGLKEVIIFGDYPWNKGDTLPAGMTRCVDWPAVEREIARIASRA